MRLEFGSCDTLCCMNHLCFMLLSSIGHRQLLTSKLIPSGNSWYGSKYCRWSVSCMSLDSVTMSFVCPWAFLWYSVDKQLSQSVCCLIGCSTCFQQLEICCFTKHVVPADYKMKPQLKYLRIKYKKDIMNTVYYAWFWLFINSLIYWLKVWGWI